MIQPHYIALGSIRLRYSESFLTRNWSGLVKINEETLRLETNLI
jgi:hypothetical protein